MVVDMLHAVAVVAVAFGTVAELHVGVVRVGDAAHGAFVEIALPVLDFLLSLFEVDGLRIDPVSSPAAPPAEDGHQIVPEEDEVVQDGHNGDHSLDPVAVHKVMTNIKGKEGRIHPGQPLHFQGQDPVEQHPHIRVQGGEGKKHGHVHVVHAGSLQEGTRDPVSHHPGENVQQDAHPVKHGEPGRPPLVFQSVSDVVVEQGGQGKPQDETAAGGDEDKGEQPPHLPFHDQGRVEPQHSGEVAVAEHIHQIDRYIGDDDVLHQTWDAEPGMLVAEAVQPAGNRAHTGAS